MKERKEKGRKEERKEGKEGWREEYKGKEEEN
jgi:hypothetical protein